MRLQLQRAAVVTSARFAPLSPHVFRQMRAEKANVEANAFMQCEEMVVRRWW